MATKAQPQPIRSWPDTIPGPTATLGWAVLQWTAEYLTQPDGPAAGRPWEFTTEQAKILLRWYAIDKDGIFLYRRGVLRRMKGWGKDPFCGALAVVELCGPCRFAGWNAKHEPIVATHPAPWIQVAAVSKDQTRNTMTLFPGLISPAAVRDFGIDIGKEIIYSKAGGRIEAVTSSARALEGGRPSLVVANETQHWLQSNDGHAMMSAIRRNLGKSRDGAARVMEITNAHLVDEGSVAELTYEAWRQSDGPLPGVYYDSTEAPPIPDLKDRDMVREGLIAARGDSTWVSLDRVMGEIADPTTTESIARRYYLDQVWSATSEVWLPAGAWPARFTKVGIPDGSDVMLAVDGSYNDDSTGIVVASVAGQPHLNVVGCWEKAEAMEGEWTVPIEDVEDTIRAACKRWRVRELLFDPYRWARTMQALQKEGLPVVEYPQSPERMITATQRFQTAVVNGTLTHSGDARLTRHIENCVVRENLRGLRIVKETKWSPRKIDLAIAAVMAHDRAAGTPTVGQGWLTYWKSQISQENAGKEEAMIAPARDILSGPDAPVIPTPPSSCQHRWNPASPVRNKAGELVPSCVFCGNPREER